MSYAARTEVAADKTRLEIERTLVRAGADRFAYAIGPKEAVISFEMKGRRYAFRLPLPAQGALQFKRRTLNASKAAHDQAVRTRWRALLLIIKAKLEAVATGIVTLEDEFLAQTVMPDGQTVGEAIQSRISSIYNGASFPLLPAPEVE